MIITRTPLRISFCGGGTDLESYYSKEGGSVVSTSINKYVYVLVNGSMDGKTITVRHDDVERAGSVGKLSNPIIRECMMMAGLEGGVEITSMSDMPGSSGLGSSSSFAVGLLNALYAYKGEKKDRETLAGEACEIEIERMKEPIGKQDQYAAAYGGLNHITFDPDESVKVEKIKMPEDLKKKMNDNLMLFFTGITRKANTILSEQKKRTPEKRRSLDIMKDLSLQLKESLISGNIENLGKLLHKNWEQKKKLASAITTPEIEKAYSTAVKTGAVGGKVLGAGGGGFLLFYVQKEKQESVRKALGGLREVDFSFTEQGSKIIHED